MIELERLAPALVGLPFVLEVGPSTLHARVMHEQDGGTVLICELQEHFDFAGEVGRLADRRVLLLA